MGDVTSEQNPQPSVLVDQDGNPLTELLDGGIRSRLYDPEHNSFATCTRFGQQNVAIPVRVLGDNFEGGALDTNLWVSEQLGAGFTITQGNGELVVSTGVLANGGARYRTLRLARFVTGSENEGICGVRIPDNGVANNRRLWGPFDANDGPYFGMFETSFGVGYRKGGVNTDITALNGRWPLIQDQNYHTYSVFWSAGGYRYIQDTKLVHTATVTTAPLANTLNHYFSFENANSNNLLQNIELRARSGAVIRHGGALTVPRWYRTSTTQTVVLKRGAGALQAVTVLAAGAAGSSLTLYDNTAASGTVIGAIDMVKLVGPYPMPAAFDIGLTIVHTSTPGDALIFFE